MLQVAGIVNLSTCECAPGVVPRDLALSPHNRASIASAPVPRAHARRKSRSRIVAWPGPVARVHHDARLRRPATAPKTVPADLTQTYMSTISAANVTGDDPVHATASGGGTARAA